MSLRCPCTVGTGVRTQISRSLPCLDSHISALYRRTVPDIRWPQSFNEMCASVREALSLDVSLDLGDFRCWVKTDRCAAPGPAPALPWSASTCSLCPAGRGTRASTTRLPHRAKQNNIRTFNHTGAPFNQSPALPLSNFEKEGALVADELRRPNPLLNQWSLTQLLRPRKIISHQYVA